MELGKVFEALEDALRMKDYEIRTLTEKNAELSKENKRLNEQIEDLIFKYEGYKREAD